MPPTQTTTDRIVCHCLGVTASQLQDAVQYSDCQSLRDLMGLTNAGKGCTACHRKIKAFLKSDGAQSPSE